MIYSESWTGRRVACLECHVAECWYDFSKTVARQVLAFLRVGTVSLRGPLSVDNPPHTFRNALPVASMRVRSKLKLATLPFVFSPMYVVSRTPRVQFSSSAFAVNQEVPRFSLSRVTCTAIGQLQLVSCQTSLRPGPMRFASACQFPSHPHRRILIFRSRS